MSSDTPIAHDDRTARLGARAFTCPHCKAYTQQRWFELRGDVPKDPPSPTLVADIRAMITKFEREPRDEDNPPSMAGMHRFADALEAGLVVVEHSSSGEYTNWSVSNLHLSECFVCDKVSVWVADHVVFPSCDTDAPEPNEDIPADIVRDYREAAAILSMSPRSAAALLRLAIQKMCLLLLKRTKGDINLMIGELVGQGLSPRVQQALDVVRVVGNEAVHPGTIDLSDDRSTATQLFRLVNLIAEAMISQPKHVAELYAGLPPSKVEAIERRDAQAKAKIDGSE